MKEGHGGERDFERDAGADADGGRVHREQDGIEGFTASLAFELEAFNMSMKLVEPGYGPTRRFTSNRRAAHGGADPGAIRAFRAADFFSLAQPEAETTEADVAEGVWRAATDVLATPIPTGAVRASCRDETRMFFKKKKKKKKKKSLMCGHVCLHGGRRAARRASTHHATPGNDRLWPLAAFCSVRTASAEIRAASGSGVG